MKWVIILLVGVLSMRPSLASCFDWRDAATRYHTSPLMGYQTYLVSAVSPLLTIDRSKPLPVPPISAIGMQAGGNEHVSVQLLIQPLIGALRNVRIECSDLVHQDTDELLSHANFKVRRVGYVNCEIGAVFGPTGPYPDVLYNNVAAEIPWEVTTQPYWVTLYVPPYQRPGTYRGRLTVKTADLPDTTIPIIMRVWGFTLPTEQPFPSDFAIRPNLIRGFFAGSKDIDGLPDWSTALPFEVYKDWLKFFLSYGITPQGYADNFGAGEDGVHNPVGCATYLPYLDCEWQGDKLVIDWTRADDIWKTLFDGGAPMIRVGYLGGAFRGNAYLEKFWTAYLPQLREHLKAKGWLDKSFLYGMDEPQPSAYGEVTSQADAVHRLAPGVKFLMTYESGKPGDPLHDKVDIWCPTIGLYDGPFADKVRKELGSSMWVYTCNGAVGRPNLKTYEGFQAARLLPWIMMREGMEGLLYYGIINWPWNRANLEMVSESGELRADFPVRDGGGMMAYPGGKKATDPPQPTIRLENLRDGIEDYQCLKMLREVARRKGDEQGVALSYIPPAITTGSENYTHLIGAIEQQRTAVSAKLEQLWDSPK